MRKLLLSLVLVLFISACQFFDSPGYTDGDGKEHPPERGLITGIGSLLKASGVPFSTAGAGLLALIGAVGTYVKHERNKKNLRNMVGLFNKMKPYVAEMTNDKDLEVWIQRLANDNTPFGKALKKAWAETKKLELGHE